MELLKKIWSWIFPILLGIGVVVLAKAFIVQPVDVTGLSMYPNLHDKEKVLCFKPLPVHRESVIVFNANGIDPETNKDKLYVKRVIGIPGDTVESRNGQIFVNGQPLNQSFISDKEKIQGTGNWDLKSLSLKNQWPTDQGAVKVPQNKYFCLGDNRSVSRDCRYFGFVPKNKILGVVKAPIWIKDTQRRNVINLQWKTPFDF